MPRRSATPSVTMPELERQAEADSDLEQLPEFPPLAPTADELLATDRPTPNGVMLHADDCMTLSPEGDPCTFKEFHSGHHSWPSEPTQTQQPQTRIVLRAPTDDEFEGADFLMVESMRDLADVLIDICPELRHLNEANVAYLWKRKGGQSKGKGTFGKCQKPAGLLAHFSMQDYIVWLAADHARTMQFTGRQLEALLFHEMLHTDIEADEDTGQSDFTTKGHDAEVFVAEIRRYGLWMADMHSLGQTIRQLPLPDSVS